MSEESGLHSFIDQRCEEGIEARMQWARKQDSLQPRRTRGYKKPKKVELVLVRDSQQAKDKGGKLELLWSTLRIVERISASGVSAHIRQPHDPPNITKHFLP